MASRLSIHPCLELDVLEASDRIGDLFGQKAAKPVGDGILCRSRGHVGGRTLKHRDVLYFVRHSGNNRHGRCPAPDHDDPLARVVKVLGPELRVKEGPLESFLTLEFRPVGLVVAVVAATHKKKVAGDGLAGGIVPGFAGLQAPKRVGTRPGGLHYLAVETNVLTDGIFVGGLVHIGEDGRSIGNGLLRPPGLEVVAEGMHIAVRPNTRVAIEIPCSPDGIATLEDRVGLPRAFLLQVIGRTDSREARAHNHDVKMTHCPGSLRQKTSTPWFCRRHRIQGPTVHGTTDMTAPGGTLGKKHLCLSLSLSLWHRVGSGGPRRGSRGMAGSRQWSFRVAVFG